MSDNTKIKFFNDKKSQTVNVSVTYRWVLPETKITVIYFSGF